MEAHAPYVERKLLSTRDVAASLGCGPDTVRRLVYRGQLRALKFSPGGALRVRPEDVDDLIERLREGA